MWWGAYKSDWQNFYTFDSTWNKSVFTNKLFIICFNCIVLNNSTGCVNTDRGLRKVTLLGLWLGGRRCTYFHRVPLIITCKIWLDQKTSRPCRVGVLERRSNAVLNAKIIRSWIRKLEETVMLTRGIHGRWRFIRLSVTDKSSCWAAADKFC